LLLMLLLDLGLLARRFGVALGFRGIQLRLRIVAIRFLPRELLLLEPRLVDPAAVSLGLPGEQLLLRRLLSPHPLLLVAARALEDPLFGCRLRHGNAFRRRRRRPGTRRAGRLWRARRQSAGRRLRRGRSNR